MNSTAPAPLQIHLNGEPCTFADGMSLHDLVQQLNLDIRKVAVEQNLAIVPRIAYGTTSIMNGDRIEIVGFIGGG